MFRFFPRLCPAAVLILALAACQPPAARPGDAASLSPAVERQAVPVRILPGGYPDEYQAARGDVLKVTVYGEPDLSGEFIIGPGGRIALPLVGAVAVAGQTLDMIPVTIAAAYRDGYLIDPKVSVELKGRN